MELFFLTVWKWLNHHNYCGSDIVCCDANINNRNQKEKQRKLREKEKSPWWYWSVIDWNGRNDTQNFGREKKRESTNNSLIVHWERKKKYSVQLIAQARRIFDVIQQVIITLCKWKLFEFVANCLVWPVWFYC